MNKKIKPLAILEILKNDTDENHIISTDDLINKLRANYKIDVDRRTIYSDIKQIIDFGFDISTFKDNGKGYYLASRDFDESEITLLCNAIHSSRFISDKYSKDLINKLLNTQGKSFRSKYNSEIYLPNNNKKDNKEFFLNIELISEAINNKKVISFNYTRFDFNKKLVKRDEKRRVMSPHHIVYTNDKVYLIGYSEEHKMVIHYRVDRMLKIEIEDDKPYIKEKNKKDPYEYAKTKIYMYAGEDNDITLRCKNAVLDDIIESFGTGISIIPDGKDYFKAYVKSSRQGIIYFALQYLNNIEVLSPKDIRKEIKETLNKGINLYK